MSKHKELEAIVSIAGQIDPSLQKSLASATKQFSGLKVGVAAVGTALIAVTSAFVGFGADACRSAAELETQMANVSTLLDGTEEQVAARTSALSDEVVAVSNEVGKATGDLSDGLYNMISAVGDSEEVMSQVELAAKAASAGGAETSDAVNLLSAVTKAYGDTSYDAMVKVSDLAFNTVKLGQTTFPELASSLQQVTGASNTLGVSQEELFGVMATATGVTGETSQVATQLKAVYSNLEKPSAAMAKALESIGYESGQAAIQQLGLQGTLDALADSCDSDINSMASMFGSAEALNLVLGLTGDLSGALTEKTAAMYEAAGATDTAFARQTDTLEYTIAAIKNLGENFKTSVGQTLLPIVKDVAQQVLPALQEGMSALKPVLSSLYERAGPFIEIIGKMASNVIPLLTSSISTMGVRWEQMQPVITVLSENLFPVFQKAFSDVGNLFETIGPVVSEFVSDLMPTLAEILSFIIPIIATVVQNLSPVLGMIGQLVSALLPALSNTINALAPVIHMVAAVINDSLANVFQFILPIIRNTTNIFSELCNFISNVFTGNWSAAWTNVQAIFANCFEALVGLAKAPINTVIAMINGVVSGINSCGFTIPDWVPVIGGKDFHLDIPEIPMFAGGGFAVGPSIAGEAGPEAVISFDSAYRDENLSYWAKAGRMLGVDDSILTAFEKRNSAGNGVVNVTFAPQITINGTGNVKEDIINALRMEEEDFMDMLEEMLDRRGGEKYGFT